MDQMRFELAAFPRTGKCGRQIRRSFTNELPEQWKTKGQQYLKKDITWEQGSYRGQANSRDCAAVFFASYRQCCKKFLSKCSGSGETPKVTFFFCHKAKGAWRTVEQREGQSSSKALKGFHLEGLRRLLIPPPPPPVVTSCNFLSSLALRVPVYGLSSLFSTTPVLERNGHCNQDEVIQSSLPFVFPHGGVTGRF